MTQLPWSMESMGSKNSRKSQTLFDAYTPGAKILDSILWLWFLSYPLAIQNPIHQGLVNVQMFHITQQTWGYFISNKYVKYGDVQNPMDIHGTLRKSNPRHHSEASISGCSPRLCDPASHLQRTEETTRTSACESRCGRIPRNQRNHRTGVRRTHRNQ